MVGCRRKGLKAGRTAPKAGLASWACGLCSGTSLCLEGPSTWSKALLSLS